VIGRTAVGVIDGDISVVALLEIDMVVGPAPIRLPTRPVQLCTVCPSAASSVTLKLALGPIWCKSTVSVPGGSAVDRNVSAMGTDKECVIAVADRKIEGLADR